MFKRTLSFVQIHVFIHNHLLFHFQGNVEAAEMARTFNCGIGVVLVVSKDSTQEVLDMVHAAGETATLIGSVVSHDKGIISLINFWNIYLIVHIVYMCVL